MTVTLAKPVNLTRSRRMRLVKSMIGAERRALRTYAEARHADSGDGQRALLAESLAWEDRRVHLFWLLQGRWT